MGEAFHRFFCTFAKAKEREKKESFKYKIDIIMLEIILFPSENPLFPLYNYTNSI